MAKKKQFSKQIDAATSIYESIPPSFHTLLTLLAFEPYISRLEDPLTGLPPDVILHLDLHFSIGVVLTRRQEWKHDELTGRSIHP